MEKLGRIGKLFYLTANVGVTIAALAFLWVAYHRYMPSEPTFPKPSHVRATLVSAGHRVEPGPLVVLALRRGCPYCERNVSLYRQLVAARRDPRTRIVAVTPEPVAATSEYLRGLGLSVDAVYQQDLPSMGVKITPTIFRVEPDDQIVKIWFGEQATDKYTAIVSKLLL